ncbi:hypothetical protein NL108_016781 [Boleophthalmus pectinirostris]|nr:hypothetical protein NL108_016781 [Boleophthalmus pectinirostris]
MSGSGSSQRLVNCSYQTTACFSRSYTASYNYGNYNYTYSYKGCASASVCTAAGSEFISYNYGPNTYAVNTTCCDTDNCNENHSIVAPPVGSLQCYSCDPSSYECTANVSCNTQEVCGQAVDDRYNPSRPFYGCVSENLCNNPTLSQRYFGFSTSVSCCSTSHCNVPDLGIQCLSCTDSSCSSQRSVTCSKLAPFCFTDAYAASYDYGSYNYSYSGSEKAVLHPRSVQLQGLSLFLMTLAPGLTSETTHAATQTTATLQTRPRPLLARCSVTAVTQTQMNAKQL